MQELKLEDIITYKTIVTNYKEMMFCRNRSIRQDATPQQVPNSQPVSSKRAHYHTATLSGFNDFCTNGNDINTVYFRPLSSSIYGNDINTLNFQSLSSSIYGKDINILAFTTIIIYLCQ